MIDKQNLFNILDPRAAHLWLVNSPVPVILILSGYFFFVYKLGPRIMQNRPAYEIKNLMMVYNFIQVICNLLLGIYVSTIHLKVTDILNIHFGQRRLKTVDNKRNLKLQGFYSSYYQPYWSFSCQNVNYSDTPLGNLELKLSYLYFLLKISDLLDTVSYLNNNNIPTAGN